MTEQTKEQILAALPPLPMHPEPRSFAWSKLEEAAIAGYGKACALGALSHPKSIEADSDVIANGDPSAWQIKYARVDGTSRTVVHEHNAIGDYRLIDPSATSTPLYAAPVVPAPGARSVVPGMTELEGRLNLLFADLGNMRRNFGDVGSRDVAAWNERLSVTRKAIHEVLVELEATTQPQAAPVAQLSEPPDPFTDDEMVCAAWALLGAAKGTKQAKAFNVGARWARSHLTSASTIPKE